MDCLYTQTPSSLTHLADIFFMDNLIQGVSVYGLSLYRDLWDQITLCKASAYGHFVFFVPIASPLICPYIVTGRNRQSVYRDPSVFPLFFKKRRPQSTHVTQVRLSGEEIGEQHVYNPQDQGQEIG